MKKETNRNINLKYKLRLVVDVEGEMEGTEPLKDNTCIEPFISWAVSDIEEAIDCTCDCVEVLKVDLEKVKDIDNG